VFVRRQFGSTRPGGEAAFFGGELEGVFAVELGLVHQFFDAGGEGLRGVGVRAGFVGVGGADEQRDFAAGGALFEPGSDLRKFTAEEFFVELGDFAGEAGGRSPRISRASATDSATRCGAS